MSEAPGELPADGRQSAAAQAIARGTRRLLHRLGFASLAEVPLRSGRRADLVAINGRGTIWIIEIKSSVADFRADGKWPDYGQHCDGLLFATSADVPQAIFPANTGLIIADAYGAELVRDAPARTLNAATRKEVLVRFATAAAQRLHRLGDPDFADVQFQNP